MNCPINKTECPCPEFSKDRLCDYPYRKGLTYEEIKKVTEKADERTITGE